MIKTVVTVCDYGKIEGGAAKVAIESAIALANIVEESILFCAVGPVDKRLKDKNVKVIYLNQYDILNNPNRLNAIIQGIWNRKAKRELKKLLSDKSTEETIIHVHSWTKAISSSIFKIVEKMGFKTVITVHDYFLACPNGGFFNYKNLKVCNAKPLLLGCLACNCDSRSYIHKVWRVVRQVVQNNSIKKRNNLSYIFISDFSKEILDKYIKCGKLYRINNPIEIKKRTKVAVDKNNTYLYVGRLSEEKGVRLFCKAVSDLNLKATVVGDGYLMNELSESYPEIEFTGWQNYDGVRKYILQARCLIFPSLWYETFGLTILEAAAFGVPSIVSDCCVGKTLTSDKLVYSSDDFNDLIKKIKIASDDDKIRELGAFAYAMYDKLNYTFDVYINELIKIYNELQNA